MARSSLFIAIS